MIEQVYLDRDNEYVQRAMKLFRLGRYIEKSFLRLQAQSFHLDIKRIAKYGGQT